MKFNSLRVGLLFFVAVLLYFPSLSHPFHYDDFHAVVQNDALKDPANIPLFFAGRRASSSELGAAAHYRPVLFTTYAVDRWIGGGDGRPFHATNILIHAANAALAAWIGSAVFGPPAGWIAGIIVAIHPLFSEGVVYVASRSTTLATLLILAAFALFIRFREERGSPRARVVWYGASIVLAGLALMAKEIAVVVPLLFLGYELLIRRGRFSVERFAPHLPFWLGGAALVWAARERVAGLMGGGADLSRVADQAGGLLKGLVLFGLPSGQTIDHPAPVLGPWGWMALGGVAGLFWLLARTAPGPAAGLGWYLVALLPATLVPLSAAFQEQRVYFPAVGLAWFAGWAVSHGVTRVRPHLPRVVLPATAVLAVVLLSAATLRREKVWADDTALWAEAARRNPASWTARGQAGLNLYRAGRLAEARAELEATLGLNPLYGHAYLYLGAIDLAEGSLDAAERRFRRALEINPGYSYNHFNLGVAQERKGNLAEAENEYRATLRLNPSFESASVNLALLEERRGNKDSARRAFRELVDRNPSSARGWYHLGRLLAESGENKAAQAAYERYVRLAGRDPSEAATVEKVRREIERLHAVPVRRAGGEQYH